MLKWLALLVQNKIALAAIGAALVAGGGAATVAVAHNTTDQQPSAAAHTTKSASSNDDTQAHTVSVVGTLKAYNAGAGMIRVQPKDDDAAATVIAVNSHTEVNGEHANSLSDLTKAVGHNVQVQATKQSDGSLVAWKITVQGTPQGGSSGLGENVEQIRGTVVSVDVAGSSFVVKLDDHGGTVTVIVNANTVFDGRSRKLADLVEGSTVIIHGAKQSDGSNLADRVIAPDDGGNEHP